MNRARRILAPAVVPALAIVSAFIVGSIFILITDFQNLQRLGTDPIGAIGSAAGGIIAAYQAMLVGAFGDPARIAAALQGGTPRQIAGAVRPLTETLVAATPLIFTGLAVAVAFRTSVFNIGVEGQFILGAFGSTVALLVLQDLPAPIPLLGAIIAGVFTGAVWGFIPGFLKARTGAHEVITTIMLNYVAVQIVLFGLRSDFLRQEGSSQPISKLLDGIGTRAGHPRIRSGCRASASTTGSCSRWSWRPSSRGSCSRPRRASSFGRPASTSPRRSTPV